MFEPQTLELDISSIASQLPPFPAVVAQLLDQLDNPSLSMDTLVHIARNDPVISANILATANRIRRINAMSDLSDAFVAAAFVGVNQIRRIIVTIGMNRFLANDIGSDFLFWHSRAVAIVAQELAMSVNMSPEKAYVGAILHDIGQLCFHVLDPEAFQAAYNLSGSDEGLLEREASIFGCNHSQLGAALAKHWMLPEEFSSAIRDHHEHDVVCGPFQALINLAESLARALDIPPSAKNRLPRINRKAMDLLGIEWNNPAMKDCFGRCRARFKHALTQKY